MPVPRESTKIIPWILYQGNCFCKFTRGRVLLATVTNTSHVYRKKQCGMAQVEQRAEIRLEFTPGSKSKSGQRPG